MSKPLPLRADVPPGDEVAVLRAGLMTEQSVQRSAERTFELYGVFGLSVEGAVVPQPYDIWVDFMDLTDDRRLWARATDARPGTVLAVGGHVIVGDDDADPSVAKILTIDEDDHIELEVLPGTVESHHDLLAPAS